jgi:hypothetical protein
MRASPTGNRTTPGLNSIAVLLYARSTLYHNQALRSRARKPVVPPQKTLRSAKLHRGRLEAMHAAIRQSYLLLPPLPTHTNSTTRKRLNSLDNRSSDRLVVPLKPPRTRGFLRHRRCVYRARDTSGGR